MEQWVEYGWLKREPTTRTEIEDLWSIVERGLDDSNVKAISTDLRFIAAFNAAFTLATIALRSSGYRTVTSAGHYVKTIGSLEFTIRADTKLIRTFSVLNNKRNKSVYDVAGVISDQDLDTVLTLTKELRDATLVWLRKEHPELQTTS